MATILTYTGRYFSFMDPRPEMIDPLDLAHHLGNCCRFAGAVRSFYSVAQHSVLVSHLVPAADALAGLLHDAAEAYVHDVTKPLKELIEEGYAPIEARVHAAICAHFGIAAEIPRSVKIADMVMLATERRDLLPHDRHTFEQLAGIEPHPERIDPLPPDAAKDLFLSRLVRLAAGCVARPTGIGLGPGL